MSSEQGAPGESKSSSLGGSGVRRIIVVILQVVITGVLLFVCAGRLNWMLGWVYIGLSIFVLVFNGSFLLRRHPEVINERGRWAKNTKGWDKAWAAIYAPMPLITVAVAGLDAARFGWSQVPLALSALGIAMFLAGNLLFLWAMMSNPYFATTVHIQDDRGHRTASSGPYRYVRHPGYVGAILFSIATPLVLGSWWALIPAGLTAVLFIPRTAMEDRTLQEELGGYPEYAKQVRYRLLPGVW